MVSKCLISDKKIINFLAYAETYKAEISSYSMRRENDALL